MTNATNATSITNDANAASMTNTMRNENATNTTSTTNATNTTIELEHDVEVTTPGAKEHWIQTLQHDLSHSWPFQ